MISYKKIIVLGSTGSIGIQTLDLLDIYTNYSVFALVAANNYKLLAQQIGKYNPEFAVILNEDYYDDLKSLLTNSQTKLLCGYDAINSLVAERVDCVVNAVMGYDGLTFTMNALKSGNKVALANKESIICGGKLFSDYAEQIIPLDSEHYAISRILNNDVEKITLTASGGAFFQEKEITKNLNNALKHPTWAMGKKITINSATMFNKVMEVIEAHYLFSFPKDKIDIVIHPQSIVHSFVHYKNGEQHASLFLPDMKIPISSIFDSAEMHSYQNCLDIVKHGELSFFRADVSEYPMLNFLKTDQHITLTIANEIAVEYFISGVIGFDSIYKCIEDVLSTYYYNEDAIDNIESIFDIIKQVKYLTRNALYKYSNCLYS
ncbi:1-deoxy-D-xylulose-5-phosphate reductoisomerase [Anaplasmataceae bacterium AB001_6]|nr:1-deoxy-D-xylulose-5-phosphate reductoisomerase [Anaplasmataceae bacterium AB001_6]